MGCIYFKTPCMLNVRSIVPVIDYFGKSLNFNFAKYVNPCFVEIFSSLKCWLVHFNSNQFYAI